MNNIITPQEIVNIAFASNSNMKADNINEYIIHATERKYLVPALGADLFNALPNYSGLCEMLKPALAFFVKCEIIPSLSLSISNGGVAVMNPQYMTAATDKQRSLLFESELSRAEALLGEVMEHIANNAADYPEFRGVGRVVSKTKFGVIL